MKKFFTKPAVTVLAIATIAGGLTPVWASSTDREMKVVMETEKPETTRYQLKDLIENNPALLNLLLKTQADYLYLVVEQLKLDVKLSTYIEENAKEWEELYEKHYKDIYLEVRYLEQEGFRDLTQEIKGDVTYITGKVSDEVTKVVIIKPNQDKIEINNFPNHSFTISIPTVESNTPQYLTLKAFAGDQLIETKKLQVNKKVVDHGQVILYTNGQYDSKKEQVKLTGVVATLGDKVIVKYGSEEKEVNPKKIWNGVGSFETSFKLKETKDAPKQAVVTVYKDGKTIASETVEITGLKSVQPDEETFEIKATATLIAKNKQVYLKGSIQASDDDSDDLKLYAIVPDGTKHQLKIDDDDLSFEANLSYKNRSYSSKAVHLELYQDGKLVAEADIIHGQPNNSAVIPGKGDADKQKGTNNKYKEDKNKGDWDDEDKNDKKKDKKKQDDKKKDDKKQDDKKQDDKKKQHKDK